MTAFTKLSRNAVAEVVTAGHLTQGTGMNGEERTSGVQGCPNAASMGEHACANRSQCWEPCGELGHSEEHVRVGRDDPAKAAFGVDVPPTEPPGSVQCGVCKAITAPGNGCSAEDCPVGVDLPDGASSSDAKDAARWRYFRSIGMNGWKYDVLDAKVDRLMELDAAGVDSVDGRKRNG